MGQIRSKLVQPISEYDMIKIMKKNVRDNIARIVYPIPVNSVEQFRIESNEGERNFLRRETWPIMQQSRPIRQISEIEVKDANLEYDRRLGRTELEEVSAIRFEKQPIL